MKTVRRLALGALIALAGCGGAEAASGRAAERAPDRGAIPRIEWADIPTIDGGEGPREVRAVVDAPHVKVVAIVLRDGTPLPVHTAPNPVTILAVAGHGVVRVGDEERPLDAAHMVSLDTEVPHAVEPAPGTDLVILVHHFRGGAR